MLIMVCMKILKVQNMCSIEIKVVTLKVNVFSSMKHP